MKNRRIREAFEKCGPDEETRREMLEWVLAQGRSEERTGITGKMRMAKGWAAACAAVLLVLSVSVVGYAAYRWLTGEQIAQMLDDKKLAEAFGQTEQDIQLKTAGGYEIAYIGSVSGKDISDETGLSEGIEPGQTYAAVAVARTDGEPMKAGDHIVVTPLIQGLEPWKYNIYTLGNGSARGVISDGVLYWIMKTQNIEVFSDRIMYIAVMDEHPDFQSVRYDPDTGLISENPEFKGLSALFTMDTESMRGDPAAAEEFLQALEGAWKEEEEKTEIKQDDAAAEEAQLKYQDIIWKDEAAGLQITLPFYNRFKGQFYGFYCQVEGSGIESITYTLDGGTFYHKIECIEDTMEAFDAVNESGKYAAYVEKECMLKPEEHKDSGCIYPGSQDKTRWVYEKAGSSYTVEYGQQENADFLYAILPASSRGEDAQDPARALEETTVTVTIRYQDGSTAEKHISFEAVETTEEKPYQNYSKIYVSD